MKMYTTHDHIIVCPSNCIYTSVPVGGNYSPMKTAIGCQNIHKSFFDFQQGLNESLQLDFPSHSRLY